MPGFEYGERNLQDLKRWNPLIGKTFWQRNPKNKDEIRTIRMHWNPFANRITPQVSNFVTSLPPEGMDEVSPRLLSSLATMQGSAPFFH